MSGPVDVLAVMDRVSTVLDTDGDEYGFCDKLDAARAAVADVLNVLRESAAALECASKCVPADLAVLLSDRALFARAALALVGAAS